MKYDMPTASFEAVGRSCVATTDDLLRILGMAVTKKEPAKPDWTLHREVGLRPTIMLHLPRSKEKIALEVDKLEGMVRIEKGRQKDFIISDTSRVKFLK